MGKSAALQTFGDKITLPSLPDVVVRINSMIDDPNVGLAELGTAAAQDPAVTARVLRLANSGYYGLREQVTSPEQAATVIGARALRNVAMQVSIVRRYEHLRNVPDFDLEELWHHSALTARIAQSLAERSQHRTGLSPEDAYACGLLHDIGRVVILEGLTDPYIECIRHARRTGSTLHAAEAELLGFTHIEVGALVASQWKLPDKVAHAIEFHHGPSSAVIEHPHAGVIAIADQIAYRASSSTFDTAMVKLGALAQRLLGITPEGFAAVLELARSPELETAG